jgi:hypothetical protein
MSIKIPSSLKYEKEIQLYREHQDVSIIEKMLSDLKVLKDLTAARTFASIWLQKIPQLIIQILFY